MRVSVVTNGGIVNVDGQARRIDDVADLIARDITAIQWYEDFGEIEFRTKFLRDEKRWDRKPNQIFDDFSVVQVYVERWRHGSHV